MNIVTLIGSDKFQRQLENFSRQLTMEGNITLYMPELDQKEKTANFINKDFIMTQQKGRIDISDFVYVMNIRNIIDDDTQLLIEYAKEKGKKIRYYNIRQTVETDNDKKFREIKDVLTNHMLNTKNAISLRRYSPARIASILVKAIALGGEYNYIQLSEMYDISARTLVKYASIYKRGINQK